MKDKELQKRVESLEEFFGLCYQNGEWPEHYFKAHTNGRVYSILEPLLKKDKKDV